MPNPKLIALAVVAALYLLFIEVTTHALARHFQTPAAGHPCANARQRHERRRGGRGLP